MVIDIKVPGVGESVQEAVLAEWYKKDGEQVKKDDILFVIETDKVTLEITAEGDGTLKILVAAGQTVSVGAVVGRIETETAEAEKEPAAAAAPRPKPAAAEAQPEVRPVAAPETPVKEQIEEQRQTPEAQLAQPAPAAAEAGHLSPSVRRLVAEHRLDPSQIKGSGPAGRITKGDVLLFLESAPSRASERGTGADSPVPPPTGSQALVSPAESRKPMSPIRKRIAARLLEARRNTAMLTTFNDIDMTRAMDLRTRFKDDFKQKHDVPLGFMSFFVKACVAALKEIPEINAFIDGEEIVYHHYQHIGIAIGSERGLVVPVIRNAERLDFAGIEKAILDFVARIENNRLELADLEGGTFTISNGGVYGSLLSTPILNTPQSGILGMHRIEKRPVALDDQVVIRPMMYAALSYDHRIVDGRGAVTFLKRIKELVENPERLLLEV